MIKDFIEVVNDLGKDGDVWKDEPEKVEVGSFSMVSSLRGSVRTFAINRALDCFVQKYGADVPENPTAEGRNKADENLKEIKDCSAYRATMRACAVLADLDEEFGIWDKDEGIEGSLQYAIESTTPKMSRERAKKLGSTISYDKKIRHKEQLERFQPDILSLLEDGIENHAETDDQNSDWLSNSIVNAVGLLKRKMIEKEMMGNITERQHEKALQHLEGYIFIAENDVPAIIE